MIIWNSHCTSALQNFSLSLCLFCMVSNLHLFVSDLAFTTRFNPQRSCKEFMKHFFHNFIQEIAIFHRLCNFFSQLFSRNCNISYIMKASLVDFVTDLVQIFNLKMHWKEKVLISIMFPACTYQVAQSYSNTCVSSVLGFHLVVYCCSYANASYQRNQESNTTYLSLPFNYNTASLSMTQEQICGRNVF